MSTYLVVALLVIGLINLLFIKKIWIFIIINVLLTLNMIIKAIDVYKNTIENLISSPTHWIILYEIRIELIALITLILGYIFLRRLNIFGKH